MPPLGAIWLVAAFFHESSDAYLAQQSQEHVLSASQEMPLPKGLFEVSIAPGGAMRREQLQLPEAAAPKKLTHGKMANTQKKSLAAVLQSTQRLLQNKSKQPSPYAGDWLYGFSETTCSERHWDNTQYSVASRVFLPVLFACLSFSVVIAGKYFETQEQAVSGATEQAAPRRHDLDYARVICIACVVTEHSGGWHWSDHNVLFVLQWVLPFLYITSGMSFMMSRKSTLEYIKRLAGIFVVGVSANWVADVLMHRNWQGDFSNTIFQMFYVVVLIALSLLTTLLRQALLSQAGHLKEKPRWQLWIPIAVFGLLTLCAMAFFVTGRPALSLKVEDSPSGHFAEILNGGILAVIQVAGIMFLSHLACLFKATDVLPWILLIHIYVPRIVIPYAGVGYTHNVELFVFAMVVQAWKMRGESIFREALTSYWPLFLFFLLLLSCADMRGRCDLLPASSIWERLRFYGIELALCVCLTAGAFKVGDPYKATEWLNSWALYAYCFHMAWARLISQPYGAVVTYSSCAAFYLRNKHNKASST